MSTVTITDEQGNKVTIPQSIWSATVEEYGKKRTWPQKGDRYYALNAVGAVRSFLYMNDPSDLALFEQGNGFAVRAEAEAVRDRRRAEAAIRKYIRDNGFEFEPNWKSGNIEKHRIFYDHNFRKFGTDFNGGYQLLPTGPFFSSDHHAQQVIRDCEAELKVLFGVKE